MKKIIFSFISVILFPLIFGCDKELNNKNQPDSNQITLNCKFNRDTSVKSLFVHIDKNKIELNQYYLHADNEKFYGITKEITASTITLKSYRKNDFNKDSYLEYTIEINRFTGEIKETIVGHFPKEKEAKYRKNEPVEFFGECETLKDRKF